MSGRKTAYSLDDMAAQLRQVRAAMLEVGSNVAKELYPLTEKLVECYEGCLRATLHDRLRRFLPECVAAWVTKHLHRRVLFWCRGWLVRDADDPS